MAWGGYGFRNLNSPRSCIPSLYQSVSVNRGMTGRATETHQEGWNFREPTVKYTKCLETQRNGDWKFALAVIPYGWQVQLMYKACLSIFLWHSTFCEQLIKYSVVSFLFEYSIILSINKQKKKQQWYFCTLMFNCTFIMNLPTHKGENSNSYCILSVTSARSKIIFNSKLTSRQKMSLPIIVFNYIVTVTK